MAMQLDLITNWRREDKDFVANVKMRDVRAKSAGEQQHAYRSWGTGLVKCLHDRSYFVECKNCKRTRSEGEENFAAFKASHIAKP